MGAFQLYTLKREKVGRGRKECVEVIGIFALCVLWFSVVLFWVVTSGVNTNSYYKWSSGNLTRKGYSC